MAYKIINGGGVIRLIDRACIPDDPNNRDWLMYQQWLRAGNVPSAADLIPVQDGGDPTTAAREVRAMMVVIAQSTGRTRAQVEDAFSAAWDAANP